MTTPTQPTPTTAGVTEAMVERAHAEYHKVLGDPNRSNPMRAALEAALSTAPPGDGTPSAIREAMQLAIDYLKETKQGSPARSPGHNARLILEAALSAAGDGVPAGYLPAVKVLPADTLPSGPDHLVSKAWVHEGCAIALYGTNDKMIGWIDTHEWVKGRVYRDSLLSGDGVPGMVLVPVDPSPEILNAIVKECKAAWGVRSDNKQIPANRAQEWREIAKPFYRAALSASTAGEPKP